MSFGIHVAGFANRRRIVNDKKYVPWACDCPAPLDVPEDDRGIPQKMNPGYLKKCLDCGTQRDQ